MAVPGPLGVVGTDADALPAVDAALAGDDRLAAPHPAGDVEAVVAALQLDPQRAEGADRARVGGDLQGGGGRVDVEVEQRGAGRGGAGRGAGGSS